MQLEVIKWKLFSWWSVEDAFSSLTVEHFSKTFSSVFIVIQFLEFCVQFRLKKKTLSSTMILCYMKSFTITDVEITWSFLKSVFLFLFLINCSSFANAIFYYGPQICLQAIISVLLDLLQRFGGDLIPGTIKKKKKKVCVYCLTHQHLFLMENGPESWILPY